jgi:hypothetical protein
MPGRNGLALPVQLAGSFRQTAGALSDFELDFATDKADSVIATGHVDLAGTVKVSLLDTQVIKPGYHLKTLYSGALGLTSDGLVLDAQPSVIISYRLAYADGHTADLSYTVDFDAAGLAGNRIAMGEYFNRIQAAGSSAALADTVIKLVAQTRFSAYSTMLTELNPEVYAEQQAYVLGSLQRFARVMQDCGSLDVGRIAGEEPGCVWARFDLDSSTKQAEEGFPATAETAHRYSLGLQHEAEKDWTFGFGLDVEKNDSHGSGWTGETTNVEVGLLGRRAFGRTSAGAVLTFGNSDQIVRRELAVTDPAVATGTREVPFVSAVFDLSHHLDAGKFAITPALDLGVSTLLGEVMKEAGGGDQALTLEGRSETHVWVEPAVAFGYDTSLGNRTGLRAYARVGALQYLNGENTEVRAGLASAPAGVAPMQITSSLDRTHFLGEVGLELFSLDHFMFGLSYTRQTSDLRDSSAGSARFVIPMN